MIQELSTYANGDHLTLEEYFRRVLHNEQFLYSSVWNWWKTNTLYWSLPLGIGSLLLFAAVLYQESSLREGVDWTLVLPISLLPFLFLPLIWIGTYYYSFVLPRRIVRKLEQFITRYIPDASDITRQGLHCTLLRNSIEYQASYDVFLETDVRGRAVCRYGCFSLTLYYFPRPGTEMQWFDEEFRFRDSFIDEWKAYCADKESCRHLQVADDALFALFKEKELMDTTEVTAAMDQLEYLLERFDFFPINRPIPLEETVNHWLRSIDKPTPPDIVAINIGIFEMVTGYCLYLTEARHYDAMDDDWACEEDFVPERKYLNTMTRTDDLDAFQTTISGIVYRYIAQKVEDPSSLFYHKVVTVGYDDGELEVVSKSSRR